MKISVRRSDGSEKVHIKFPDIVVCNTRQIIGIVELKYQPRVRPSWRKDIGTFDWIDKHKDKISVSNVRFQGVEVDKRPYCSGQLTPDTGLSFSSATAGATPSLN